MKKTLTLILALALLLSSFSFAVAEEKDRLGGLTLPLSEEPATLTMFFNSPYEMTKDTWIFQEIFKRTNVQIEPICFSPDIINEKFNNYLASAELPDIFTNGVFTSGGEMIMYGEQGALASPDDYLDLMPNFKNIFYNNPANAEIYKLYASEQGKNYTFPIYRLNRDVNFGYLYRQDIMDELGLEPWTDTESFYNALLAMKKAYPDSYPFATAGIGPYVRMAANFDLNDIQRASYDYETKKWFISASDARFKEMLDLLKRMYNDGLLDPEFMTASLDSFNAKMLNNKAFVTNNWIGRMALLDAQGKTTNEKFNLCFGYPIGNGKSLAMPAFTEGGVCVANNENTALSMKMMDYLYSEEGSELLTIGSEGDNFEWDENGKPVYKDIEGPADIVKLEEKYGLWLQGMYVLPDRSSCYYNFTEKEQFAQDLINEKCGYIQPVPPFKMTDEEAEVFAQLTTGLWDDTQAFLGSYVMTKEYGEKEWNEFSQNIMTKYGNKLLEILNK